MPPSPHAAATLCKPSSSSSRQTSKRRRWRRRRHNRRSRRRRRRRPPPTVGRGPTILRPVRRPKHRRRCLLRRVRERPRLRRRRVPCLQRRRQRRQRRRQRRGPRAGAPRRPLEGALGLSGGDLHVVDTACTMLQVPRRRGSLRDRALTCWEKLGSPALPQPGGGGASNAVGGPSVLGGVAIARPVSDGEAMYLAQSAAGGEVACGGAGASSSGGGGASSSSPSLAGPSAPWTCAVCTFLHDTPSNVSFLACEICGTPKP